MKHLRRFNDNTMNKLNENLDNEPYIIICFNVNLRQDDNKPIRGIKKMKRWFEIINNQNIFISMSAGKNIYIEKHNFETMEDLDKWESEHSE